MYLINYRYLFYADKGGESREKHPTEIGKAFMDGSMRTFIVRDKIYAPQALTLDDVNKVIYWTDSHMDSLSCVDYFGQHRYRIG